MTVVRRTQVARSGFGAALALLLVAVSTPSVATAQSSPPNESNQKSSSRLQSMLDQAANDAGGNSGTNANTSDPGFGEQGVTVSEYMTVDLFVQDEDLANVLQMLSLQSQRNIVASRDVTARVTANLYGVTFFEALDAILNVNGFGYVEQGNFIYVHTLEELAQIQQEQREMVSAVVTLNYLNANDAAEFVVPLLSDAGSIKTNGDVGIFKIPKDTPTGSEEFALAATMVIFDYAEHVEEIVALIDQLDTRPSQVLVEATILQTQLNEANAWGIDFAFIKDLEFSDFFTFGGAANAANALIKDKIVKTTGGLADGRGTGLNVSPGNTAGPATLKLAVLHDDIGVFVRMLDEVSDVTILSNPKILALNRQPARVLVGRKLGYLNTTATQTSTTQTVEFLDTGTQLSFRPFISKDGNIRLELKPRVSEGVIREAVDATGAAVTIPDEITQELTTNVIVPDGSTIVLGGLFKETTMLSRRQVPLIGDIPIIGAAFRGHEDDTERQEIIFLITPTIMNDEIMLDMGQRALTDAERVRTGSRRGLLPWSRERQTAQLNMKARDYAKAGEVDRALWCLRRSLELHPSQPDAIRVRELLGGDIERWPHRSLLDEIIAGDVAAQAAKIMNMPMPNAGDNAMMPRQFDGGINPTGFFNAIDNNTRMKDFLGGAVDLAEQSSLEYDPFFENERSTFEEFGIDGETVFEDSSLDASDADAEDSLSDGSGDDDLSTGFDSWFGPSGSSDADSDAVSDLDGGDWNSPKTNDDDDTMPNDKD